MLLLNYDIIIRDFIKNYQTVIFKLYYKNQELWIFPDSILRALVELQFLGQRVPDQGCQVLVGGGQDWNVYVSIDYQNLKKFQHVENLHINFFNFLCH